MHARKTSRRRHNPITRDRIALHRAGKPAIGETKVRRGGGKVLLAHGKSLAGV